MESRRCHQGEELSEGNLSIGRMEMLQALPVGMVCCLFDDALTFLWGNSSFFQLVGYSKDDYLNRFPSLKLYLDQQPEDFQAVRTGFSHDMNPDAPSSDLTISLPRRDGTCRWTCLSGNIMSDAGSGRQMLCLAFTDVDALVAEKEKESLLAVQRMQYFHWMMDAFVGNVYICDMETHEMLYMNKQACDTLGTSLSNIIGKKCYDVIQGRNSPCPFCTNDKLSEDDFYEWEFFNPTLDRTFLIKDRIVNWNGRRARIELSHDMFSKEYGLEKKDREREAVIKSIPGGFARLDARDYSTILWYGAGFLDLIGYTAEQFEEELHSQCAYVHPDDFERIVSTLGKVADTRENMVTEARILTRSGETKILIMTVSYASAEESWDGIPSFYSVGVDITKERAEQTRQRQALEVAYEAAHVANTAKTNFLSAMSHDIRTPMNAIMGMTAIAQANLRSPDKVHDCLEKINVSSRHLLSLINDILDISKIENGKNDLLFERVDLPELLQDITDMCRPLIDEKHLNFQFSATQIRHEKVMTDGNHLRQVFVNLLSNAIKYTPAGGSIGLTVLELPSGMPDTNTYEFVFSDDGIGISEDFLHRIFVPFARAEDPRANSIQGTGLGLAIAENIVHMMNGTIHVQSEQGAGSRFTVTVPLELSMEGDVLDTVLLDRRVLIVDSDLDVCDGAASLLNELGLRVSCSTSGADAVSQLNAAHDDGDDFFAVIVDCELLGPDCLITVRHIREKMGEYCPRLVVSSFEHSNADADLRAAGVSAFIIKPLFKSKMVHVLQSLCQESFSQDEVRIQDTRSVLSGKRMLLAEDNELNREIAVELLRMYGILVDTVENGRQAVETFYRSSPGYYDCILMDIQMPVMDGYMATERIRSLVNEDAMSIPIIAMTANAFVSDIGKARSAGMNDHVAKPIDVDRLLNVLQRWLR